MFCPYCKGTLELKNGELYCLSGNSYFSKRISNYFISKITNIINKDVCTMEISSESAGYFFCVNCGEKMKRSADLYEVCTSCGFDIDRLSHYEIVELNPHR